MRPHGIQVGSYPVLYKGVFVSLIGRDLDPKSNDGTNGKKVWLAEVAREVEREIGGRVASEEDIAAQKNEPSGSLTTPSQATPSTPRAKV